MITLRTSRFEATVNPFDELPVARQYQVLALAEQGSSVTTACITLLRDELPADKVGEFDQLPLKEIMLLVDQFIGVERKPAATAPEDCDHNHDTKAECDAYQAGARDFREFLLSLAAKIGGRKSKVLREFLEGVQIG